MATQKPAPSGANLLSTLADLRRGKFLAEADERLAELTAAVRETRKAGTLTLRLTIKPFSKGDPYVLAVDDRLSSVVPELDRGSTVMFTSDAGGLSTLDTRQSELDLSPPAPAPAPAPAETPPGVRPFTRLSDLKG